MKLKTYQCLCGSPCKSSLGLSIHQRSCKFIQQSGSLSSEGKKAKWQELKGRKAEKKRQTLLARQAESNMGSSSNLSQVAQDDESIIHPGMDDVQHDDFSLNDSLQSSEGIQAPQDVQMHPLHHHDLDHDPPNSPVQDCSLSPQIPTPTSLGRPRRQVPKRYTDTLPEAGIAQTPDPPSSCNEDEPLPVIPRLRLRLKPSSWRTPLTRFGLFREYRTKPSHIPDKEVALEDLLLTDQRVSAQDNTPASADLSQKEVEDPDEVKALWTRLHTALGPFPNLTAFWLHKYHDPTTKKSLADRNKLVNIVLHRLFKPRDMDHVNLGKIDKVLLSRNDDSAYPLPRNDGWTAAKVQIKVPIPKEGTHTFEVDGLYYRKLVDVVRSSLEDPRALRRFHFHPFRQFWQPKGEDGPYERVYDELYTSDAMVEEEEKLQSSAREPGCDLERVIVALMLASDATHLANFGQAKAWPVYLYFGNESKYERCRPSANCAEHIAFLPTLPDKLQDFIRKICGSSGSSQLFTHCRRELMHELLKLLMDPEFVAAWKHGIVIKCSDGIFRRFYLRIFTYSADYPEKVLLAAIRDMGSCPCPRCLIKKQDIPDMGLPQDLSIRQVRARKDDSQRQILVQRARKEIYQKGFAVNSKRVEDILKPMSLVPTENAFSAQLSKLEFDFHQMLVNDVLHEIELGEWKTLFTHFIRILHAISPSAVDILNERYRKTPPFSRDTIRPFSDNVSEMKKLAARDFEDILQCAIPAFEGLLPDVHNRSLLSLIFVLSEMHALIKLRFHTETTLQLLQEITTLYGIHIRNFKFTTSSAFHTVETPKEYGARGRRVAKRIAQQPGTSTSQATVPRTTAALGAKQERSLNLERYKFHAIGDYYQTIHRFGTSDSYTTGNAEREHTKIKARYNVTSKNRTFVKQITNQDRIRRQIDQIDREVTAILDSKGGDYTAPKATRARKVRPISGRASYEVAETLRKYHHIPTWLSENEQDPAFKASTITSIGFTSLNPVSFGTQEFRNQLQDHILSRLRGEQYDGDETEYSQADRNQLSIRGDRLYRHKHMRFNYTTYDVKRNQDSISLRTNRCNVMFASNEDSNDEQDLPDHPFWYARVLGIFTVVASEDTRPERDPERLDILWIRWYGRSYRHLGGFDNYRLDRVGFIKDSPGTFGFVDPSLVIRACHIIPAFHYGRTQEYLGRSIVQDKEGDWRFFYVGRFVDRDMYMRYRGGGVGHIDPAMRAGSTPAQGGVASHGTHVAVENQALTSGSTENYGYPGSDSAEMDEGADKDEVADEDEGEDEEGGDDDSDDTESSNERSDDDKEGQQEEVDVDEDDGDDRSVGANENGFYDM